MNKAMRYLVLSGSIFALPGLLILRKVILYRHRNSISGHYDGTMYEKLRESKAALDSAASVIQSTLADMERENSQKDR